VTPARPAVGDLWRVGLALDGFPIYGADDMAGAEVTADKLDECNGNFSSTPEFPNGIYHYVLPNTTDKTSSIRCFHCEVEASQIRQMPPMMGPPDMMGPPPVNPSKKPKRPLSSAKRVGLHRLKVKSQRAILGR
jgi:hypothetical protein